MSAPSTSLRFRIPTGRGMIGRRGEGSLVTLACRLFALECDRMCVPSLPRLLGLLLALSVGSAPCSAEVEVVRVKEQLPASNAGIQPGDRLHGWEQVAIETVGALETVFDLVGIERERAPRSPVTLLGTRSGAPLRWVMPAGAWGMEVRPMLAEPIAADVREAEQLRQADDPASAARAFAAAAAALEAAGKKVAAVWAWLQSARVLGEARSFELIVRPLDEAERIAAGLDDPAILAATLLSRRTLLTRAGDGQAAMAACSRELEVLGALPDATLRSAGALYRRGRLRLSAGESAAGNADLTRALALRDEHAPTSLALTQSLDFAAYQDLARGDVDAAQQRLDRAMAIHDELGSEGAERGATANYHGMLSHFRGEQKRLDV